MIIILADAETMLPHSDVNFDNRHTEVTDLLGFPVAVRLHHTYSRLFQKPVGHTVVINKQADKHNTRQRLEMGMWGR